MCWTAYHCELQCGVHAVVVVALVFIADGATADNRGRCKLCKGVCVGHSRRMEEDSKPRL